MLFNVIICYISRVHNEKLNGEILKLCFLLSLTVSQTPKRVWLQHLVFMETITACHLCSPRVWSWYKNKKNGKIPHRSIKLTLIVHELSCKLHLKLHASLNTRTSAIHQNARKLDTA